MPERRTYAAVVSGVVGHPTPSFPTPLMSNPTPRLDPKTPHTKVPNNTSTVSSSHESLTQCSGELKETASRESMGTKARAIRRPELGFSYQPKLSLHNYSQVCKDTSLGKLSHCLDIET